MFTLPARRRHFGICAAVAATLLGASASPAAAHGLTGLTAAGAKPLSEARLRVLETRLLGPAHAEEHAAQRAVLRDPRARARLARASRAAKVRGRKARAAAAGSPIAATDGSWAAPVQLPEVAIHAAMLSTGKVLIFGSANRVTLWDPQTESSRAIDSPRTADGAIANVFCSGQSFLADGRLLVTGGQLEGRNEVTDYKGLNTVFIFDPVTERWTQQPSMRDGRWYPTQVLQPDGRTVIMDGRDASGTGASNNDVEVFTPSPDRSRPGSTTQLGRRSGAGEPPAGGLYPHLFVMPSGRTLVAGPESPDSWFLNSLGSGLDFSWSDTANPSNHFYSSAVLLPKDTPGSSEVALIGGDEIKDVETFDEANASAGWTDSGKLNEIRAHHNTVLLPDGSMVTVGGGYGQRGGDKSLFAPGDLKVELYNPATRTWRLGAAQQEGRAYHSTALLLPDGRVMSAGDDTNGGNDTDTAEIYSPPYLFDANGNPAARPTVQAAPDSVGYGQGFGVTFGSTDVKKAVLIAPAAVTHSTDMSQRYVPLTMSAVTAGSATLTAPANANLAPPGRYMLFLVNSKGVPSQGRFVQVGTASAVAGNGTASAPTGPAVPVGPAGPAPQSSLLKLSTIKRQTLGAVRRRGLQAQARCARTCKLSARLQIKRATARTLKLVSRRRGSSYVSIGSDSVTVRMARTGRLDVKLTRSAGRRLARTREIEVRLVFTAADTRGVKQTLTRRLTLRR